MDEPMTLGSVAKNTETYGKTIAAYAEFVAVESDATKYPFKPEVSQALGLAASHLETAASDLAQAVENLTDALSRMTEDEKEKARLKPFPPGS